MAGISVGSVSVDVVPSVRSFARQMRREILPDATRVGTEAGRAMAQAINEQIDKIQIRVDTGRVLARIAALNQALDRLDGRAIKVHIDVDMTGAVAELRLLRQILDRLDGRRINIDVDAQVAAALSRIAAVNTAANSIDNRRSINIDVDTGGAVASTNRLKRALIELGLLASPALVGIGAGVIGLIGPLSAAAIGFGAVGAVAIPAISRISEALKAQKQAQQQAAASAAQAQSRALAMAGAQQQLAAAVRNAGHAHEQALEQVRSAEQQLTQAQQSAVSAQRALNDARNEARRQLQDLANNVASARLAERQGVFDVADAERELARVRADPKATRDQIARADLAADQARQRLKEQRLNLQRLVADEKRASKAGVEGSKVVQDARERLADANRRIADSERALASARANVARTDQQSAEAVASARRALTSASMQGAAANSALAASLAALTPLERQVMAAWQDLTATYQDWAKALQPDVMPVLLKGISLVKASLPLLTPIVKSSAQAIGGLLDRANAAAKSPFWTQFSQFLGATAGPAITQLGVLAGSLLKSLAGLAMAFAPIGFAFLEVLNTVFARFAAFTTGLADNPAFQRFVDQFVAVGPLMADALSSLGSLVGSLVAALAPAMRPILTLVDTLASTLAGVLRQVTPALTAVFTALGSALGVLVVALGPVVAQLVQALAPLLVQLIDGLKPILLAIVPILSQVIVALQPVISALLAGLQPALQAVVPILGLLVGTAAALLNALTPLLVPLGRLIADMANGLLPVIQPIAGQLQQLAAQALGALVDAIIQSLPSIRQIGMALIGLLPSLLQLAPLMLQWATAFVPLIPPLAELIALLVVVLTPALRVLIGVVTLLLAVFVGAVRAIVSVTAPALHVIVGSLRAVGAAARWLWTVAQLAFHEIGVAATWLWNKAIAPAFRGIATVAKWLYSFIAVVVIGPLLIQFKLVQAAVTLLWRGVFAPFFRLIGGIVRSVWQGTIRPALQALVAFVRGVLASTIRWIYTTIIRPVWTAAGSVIRSVYNAVIKPTLDKLSSAVRALGGAFRVGVDAIRSAWDKLKDAAKKPVAFVVNTVFNRGIVRLWNSVANLVPGVGKLTEIKGFARGGIVPTPYGVLPGYSPGKDTMLAAVSPGEGWMRPEWTRAVGPQMVNFWNEIARKRGVAGVRKWFTGSDAMGGEGINFARGGVVPGFAGQFGLGGIVGGFLKSAKDFFSGGLVKAASRAFSPLVEMARRAIGGTAFGDLAVGTVKGLTGKILGFYKPLEEKISGGPGVNRALAWVRAQAGKPYLWGGVGPAGYDCSGLWSAIVNLIRGRNPYSRLFTTYSFGASSGPGGFVRDLASQVRVGVTDAGVGHMAGTLGRVNVESSGGAGVRVGGGARGYNDGLFTRRYGLRFDSGGYLPTGPSLVYNGTGRPEPVLTRRQLADLRSSDGRTVNVMPHSTVVVRDRVDVDLLAQRQEYMARSAAF